MAVSKGLKILKVKTKSVVLLKWTYQNPKRKYQSSERVTLPISIFRDAVFRGGTAMIWSTVLQAVPSHSVAWKLGFSAQAGKNGQSLSDTSPSATLALRAVHCSSCPEEQVVPTYSQAILC